jgi:hypothetical protein
MNSSPCVTGPDTFHESYNCPPVTGGLVNKGTEIHLHWLLICARYIPVFYCEFFRKSVETRTGERETGIVPVMPSEYRFPSEDYGRLKMTRMDFGKLGGTPSPMELAT